MPDILKRFTGCAEQKTNANDKHFDFLPKFSKLFCLRETCYKHFISISTLRHILKRFTGCAEQKPNGVNETFDFPNLNILDIYFFLT